MLAENIVKSLNQLNSKGSITKLLNKMMAMLPGDEVFITDKWDVLDWSIKIKNSTERNIYFDPIKHDELKLLCKIWVLHSRLTKKNASVESFNSKIKVFEELSNVLGNRKFTTIKTDDLTHAEKLIIKKYSGGTPFRTGISLQEASKWLNINFSVRLDYICKIPNPAVHGRYGTEIGREEKLIQHEVLSEMLKARNRTNLTDKDGFFLSAMAIAIATGFRIGELATLPANCMIKIDGKLHLLHFPEKSGKTVPRPIHPLMAEMVEDAVNKIVEITKNARDIAKNLKTTPKLDWTRIIDNEKVFRYFIEKWAYEWTEDPNHKMINPNGAWYNKGQCFIDVISAYKEAGCNKVQAAKNLGLGRELIADLMQAQEAAQRGELPKVLNQKSRGKERSSWDTDARVISFNKLKKYLNIELHQKRKDVVRDIIENAQELQLKGLVYPMPALNGDYETDYLQSSLPILKDKNGKVLLYQDEALFLIQKYMFSEQRDTKPEEITYITDGQFIRWLSGESRSRGTGNHEDSVFIRLGIIDPRTGENANFTSHDIRHWLNTIYQNGGLSEDQIALIFNRRYPKQNAVYDQTNNKIRVNRLKQAVRDKVAVGQVTESYNKIADFSREDAEEYLSAVLRMANPMPHGVCMLDWATTPCPHHLSCFSCSDEKKCENLVIEPKNDNTVSELLRMQRESLLVINAVKNQGIHDSPTLDHFNRIHKNVSGALIEVQNVIAKG